MHHEEWIKATSIMNGPISASPSNTQHIQGTGARTTTITPRTTLPILYPHLYGTIGVSPDPISNRDRYGPPSQFCYRRGSVDSNLETGLDTLRKRRLGWRGIRCRGESATAMPAARRLRAVPLHCRLPSLAVPVHLTVPH